MKMIKKIEKDTKLEELLNKYFASKDIYFLRNEKRIRVNGSLELGDLALEKGDVVEIDITKNETRSLKEVDYPLDILYEDEVCLVVNKPEGIIIHDDSTDSVTLDNYVAAYYTKTNQSCRVYHIHRLDKDTSGTVLYCKQPLLVAFFDKCLKERRINRKYLALVAGKIEKEMTIDRRIGKDRHINNKYRVSSTGKDAITTIKPTICDGKYTLLQCSLQTGRTHQIRVHLQYIGHPIVGDEIYGGQKANRMMLHAYKIAFPHPITDKRVFVNCRPSNFPAQFILTKQED